jgi:hypothetical protein
MPARLIPGDGRPVALPSLSRGRLAPHANYSRSTGGIIPGLNRTKTHANLKAAFAGESQANRRYLYVVKVADVEGYPEDHVGT